MVRVRSIRSLDDDPNLAPYRTMRRQEDHRAQGLFVAEGEKIVRRLLESPFLVVSVLMPERWLRHFQPLLESRSEEIQAYVAEKQTLEALTGYSFYQGVLAVGRIPAPSTLGKVLATRPRPHLLAAADGLSSAENLGALVRNCAAFGVQALLAGETSCSPWLRRAVRSSMGGIFKVPAVETPSLLATLRELRARGVRCIAAHPHADRVTLSRADFTGDCCIVFGSEGQGLTPKVLAACDEAVAVPMAADVDSLNVGSAAAVFLYEASRQRGNV
jgi:tRNA G18 (ribose-2'-O)-methylase SpoU